MRRTSVNLTQEDYDAVQEMARARNVSAARLIREACEVILGVGELTAYDNETLAMLRETYPRMHFAEIVRELMFQWRLRRANGGSKADQLALLLTGLTQLQEARREDRRLLEEILMATTTTTTNPK